MKKVILIVAVVITGLISFFISCDKIEKPYRVEEVVLECDTPSFPTLTANDIIQKYLLEDYTAQQCVYCPNAQTTAKNLKVQMGDTLVLMAVHVGNLAIPDQTPGDCAFTADYRTEAGNAYSEVFNTSSLPTGLINRWKFGSSYTVGFSKWKNVLDTIVRKVPSIGIQIIPEYNIETDKACVFVKTSLFSNVSRDLRICVLLIENGIISPQKTTTAPICDYEQNHVLRKALSPAWGHDLDISNSGDAQIKGYALSFSGTTWKKENCDIIAFVYDKNTYEVLQVEEIKLVE